MRKKLGRDEGVRKKFTAVFSRTGKKTNFKGYSEDTLLLTDVRDELTNEPVCDHLWFTYSKTFNDARLREGMKISFEARVKSYSKGYVNKALGFNRKSTDFKLSHPTKVTVIGE
jgi:hypothetical protein